jgi:hypothetical protein
MWHSNRRSWTLRAKVGGEREQRRHWQHVRQLILEETDLVTVSWQLRLAVLKDAKLDVASDQAIAKEAGGASAVLSPTPARQGNSCWPRDRGNRAHDDPLLLHLELLNECSKMRRNGSSEAVVLVLQALPNC